LENWRRGFVKLFSGAADRVSVCFGRRTIFISCVFGSTQLQTIQTPPFVFTDGKKNKVQNEGIRGKNRKKTALKFEENENRLPP